MDARERRSGWAPTSTGIAEWFVEHRLADGGWNCEWVEGSTRSSFHSTLNTLKGLLAYEAGDRRDRRDACGARRAGEEYLLERGLMYRRCRPASRSRPG